MNTTLQDFVRDVSNALRPRPQPPPAYAYPVRPVPVAQAPMPIPIPAPTQPSATGSLVSSSAHTHSLDKAGLLSWK